MFRYVYIFTINLDDIDGISLKSWMHAKGAASSDPAALRGGCLRERAAVPGASHCCHKMSLTIKLLVSEQTSSFSYICSPSSLDLYSRNLQGARLALQPDVPRAQRHT